MNKIIRRISFFSFLRNILLLGADLCAYYFAMVTALCIRMVLPKILYFLDFPNFKIDYYFLPETNIILIILIMVFISNELYQKRRSFWEESLLIFKSLIISSLICYLFLFNFKEILPFISRFVIICLYFFIALFLPIFRLILNKILSYLTCFQIPILIVSNHNDLDKAVKISQIFENDFYLGFIPKYFFIENHDQSIFKFRNKDIQVINNVENLPDDMIVFILGNTCQEENPLLMLFYSRYQKVYLIPDTKLGLINSGIQYLFTERLFIIKLENQLNSVFSCFIKFIMDFILGYLIVFLLSPVFIIIAIIIKLLSPGPIFYKQERIGKKGKPFKIWKFRTMYIDADQKLQTLLAQDSKLKKEWNKYFKLKNDPRITPIGKILRKYSLDELPQFFNILLGEMSLVGPRPFVKGEIEEINPSLLELYSQVKPGLTGLWQVSGRNQNDRLERINIDIWYIQNWHYSLDILILLNTPIAVISGRGAS